MGVARSMPAEPLLFSRLHATQPRFNAPRVDDPLPRSLLMKTRRDFLRIAGWSGLGLFGFPGATVAGPRPVFAIPEKAGYGPLGPADGNGLQLPKGFSSRIVAVATERPLPSVAFNWHRSPDGGADTHACWADSLLAEVRRRGTSRVDAGGRRASVCDRGRRRVRE